MKEQKSDQKPHKEFEKEDSEILSKLDKLSAIALEQNKIAPSNEGTVVQKEKDAFEGNSEASFIIETLRGKGSYRSGIRRKS